MRSFVLAGAALAAVAMVPAAHAQMAAPSTQAYVAGAGASDKFEIEEARLAERRSHNPQVLSFARRMIRDHTKSTQMVVAAATRSMGHKPPPPVLTGMQVDNMNTLRGTAPADFNRVYITQQLASHKQALELQQSYAQNGTDPALKHAAEKIVPVVQMHLDIAEKLAAKMGVS